MACKILPTKLRRGLCAGLLSISAELLSFVEVSSLNQTSGDAKIIMKIEHFITLGAIGSCLASLTVHLTLSTSLSQQYLTR